MACLGSQTIPVHIAGMVGGRHRAVGGVDRLRLDDVI